MRPPGPPPATPRAAELTAARRRRRSGQLVGARRRSRRDHADWPGRRAGGRASECYLRAGQARAAARARAIAGEALRRRGRIAEAREQLTAALKILRADPDTNTVRALDQLAFARCTSVRRSGPAVRRGAQPGPGARRHPGSSATVQHPGDILGAPGAARRPPPTTGKARGSPTRPATTAPGPGVAQPADALVPTDPAAAAETARTAAGQLRRAATGGPWPWR